MAQQNTFTPLVIIGVDEAGRGAWAGPVVAAAAVMKSIPERARDSKKLTHKLRELLFDEVLAQGQVAVGAVSAKEIDRIGIKKATNKAMRIAVESLLKNLAPYQRVLLLVDGNDAFTFSVPHQSFVRGDDRIPLISCASIIAKVHRDRLMCEYDKKIRGYGFGAHKGYGTKLHQDNLLLMGVSPIHRRTYAPIKKMLES